MFRHCTALAAAVLLVTAAAPRAQAPPQPVPGDAAYAIFLRGTQIGREQMTLAKTDTGWVITSSGRTSPPLDFTVNRFEMKYTPTWEPLEMTLEAHLRTMGVNVRTSFTMTTAINEILQNNVTGAKEDQISVATVVIPNNVFAAYQALAVRLWNTPANTEIPVYVAPSGEIKARVESVVGETLKGPAGTLATRRFGVTLQATDRPVKAFLVVDEHLRLVRLEIPDVGLQVVREDVSSVAVRAQSARNPTDADVTIKANGFNLGGTLTTPSTVAGRLHYPVVLLVGGTSPADRDETIAGVPVFLQLARALADSGHIVLRYDRRGTGQSGGRTDTATLQDYADDALAAIKWLADRDDIDKQRIVIAGHMDGGPVALIAAAASKTVNGVITIDAAGSSGADLTLMQQQKILDGLQLTAADRQARIALQKRIQSAVVKGSGWEGIPEPMRRQADTPWFKSLLTYEPAAVLVKVRQPMLILHADQDPAVPPSEADRLGELAKARKKSGASEVVHVADVSNTLAPAGATQISAKIADAIAGWIHKL